MSSLTEQSGTAGAVGNEPIASYPTPDSSQYDSQTNNITSPIYTDLAEQGNGDELVGNDNDSDIDSLFGDISDLNEILENAAKEDDNNNVVVKNNTHNHNNNLSNDAPQTPVKKTGSAHSYGELTGSGRRSDTSPTRDQLSFPTVAPLTFPTVTPKSNKTINTSTHEEIPVNASVGSAVVAISQPSVKQTNAAEQVPVNQTVIGNAVSHNGTFASTDETKKSRKQAEVTSHLLAAPTDKTAIPASDSSGSFTGLANGAIPKADFSSSILFGPELQKALFTDGEASADPDLPVYSNNNAACNGAEAIQATVAIVEEDIAVPDTPQRPPASLPSLTNIPMTQAPTFTGRYAGPANHNAMPTKPDTPLADQLRADFFDKYRQEKQLLSEYREAYRIWLLFTTNEDNKTQPEFSTTAEHHKSSAMTAQVAWAKHHARFENWKTGNPAVGPIIANIHEDTKALKTAEKQKAERAQFIQELRGKSAENQRYELARYDHFTSLMKESREREMWRSRVEAQIKAQEMVLAQRQAVIDEQKRIAAERKAEEERKKKEVEEQEKRKKEEAEKAEETRLLEEKLVAMLAQSAEEGRIRDEAKRAAEAEREAEENAVLEALGMQEDGTFGFPEPGQLESWSEIPAGMTTNAVIQNHDQAVSDQGHADQSLAPPGDSDNFEQQFQDAFGLQEDADMQLDKPLDFDAIFAEQETHQTTDLLTFDYHSLPESDEDLVMQAAAQGADQHHFDFNTPLRSVGVPAQQTPHGTHNHRPDFAAAVQPISVLAQPVSFLNQSISQSPVQHEASFTTQMQPDAAFDQPVPFPELPSVADQAMMVQAHDARAEEFFSADVQAQLPSISEVMSETQLEPLSCPLPADVPIEPKKPRSRKKKTPAKSQTNAGTASSGVLAMPDVHQQQMTSPSFGLDQVMDSDPFVNSTASQQLNQMPAMAQTSSGTAPAVTQQPVAQMTTTEETVSGNTNPVAQQDAQMLDNYSMFVQHPSRTPPKASLSAMQSPLSGRTSTRPSATQSSDNKRKASAAYGTETPTKRRLSVNRHGTVVPIAQPPPLPAGAQNTQSHAQNIQTPARQVQAPAQDFHTPQQIPVDPALHFGISPASDGTIIGTSIKAGICAAIKLILKEARTQGTVLSHMLIDGPAADFTGSEARGRIKEATKYHLVKVSATKPDTDRQAFINGAYKVLQGVLEEVEGHGTVFGNALLMGPIAGPELLAAKRAMVVMYREAAASYESPPRVDEGLARSAQVQQTPTRARHGLSNGIGNLALAGSSRLSVYPVAPGTPAMGHGHVAFQQPNGRVVSPQQSGHAVSSSPMQHYPVLPIQNTSPSPMHGYPRAAPHMNGSAIPTYPRPAVSDAPLMNTYPEPTNPYQQQHPHQHQQEPHPKPKKTPARKPRARKASTKAPTPSRSTPANNPNPAKTNHKNNNNTPISETETSTGPTPGTATATATTTATGQCIPRLYYRFADASFYMQLTADAAKQHYKAETTTTTTTTTTHHRMGRGTDAAEAALARFLEGARGMGVVEVRGGFVFRVWEGVEAGLRSLRGFMVGGGGGGGGM
ncbi:hypothetical protein NEMBOFW57_009936 [Staphylotrichum longicolle]|uniref:Uncharacterized protein n=1 Tax=Staphylotrichum longicolle TaxID=669026 RepID=A0AAD4EPZ5_9PEZI|nr:hypothetical protein NEMBOFW57_009936 [Staphylotrichum longicolle]